jgi:hypothetical protein
MHCHLFVPDFFRFGRGAEGGARLPAAETLIAKGRRRQDAPESPEEWLCRRFGVARQRDWPVAPYTLMADGGAPGGHYWLRADPVHLQVDHDRLILADDASFRLSREEAESLVEKLNGHLRERVTLYPMHPTRWYARLEATPDLATVPLAEVRGNNIQPSLPSGADAMRFNTLMNEAQMLLFGHPDNVLRETQVEPPINSIWFWGGGVVSSDIACTFTHVVAEDPLARGLARAAGVPARALPDSGALWLVSAPREGVVLVVLDALREPASYGDREGFLARRLQLERDWFAPILGALRSGLIGMVTLHLSGPDALLEAETVRPDLRYFWRRHKPVAAYVQS